MRRGRRWVVVAVANQQPNEAAVKSHHKGNEQSSVKAGISFADVLLFLVPDQRRQLANLGQLGQRDDTSNDDEKRNEFHVDGLLSKSVMEFHALLKHGVILADERRLCQSGKRPVHEEPQEAQEHSNFKETKLIMVKHCSGNDQQVHVHEVGDEDEDGHGNDKAWVAFGITGEQHIERHGKIHKEHGQERHLIIPEHTAHVIRDFLRDVGVPNQEELTQPQL